MSTFISKELSQQSGEPAFLYEFQLGTTVRRFHNVEGVLDVLGNDWNKESISHDEPEVSAEARTSSLAIHLPASNVFVSEFTVKTPTAKAIVLIRRVQLAALTDPKLFFQGVVRNLRWTKGTTRAALICAPVEGRFAKRAPRVGFSSQCPNMLFDINCKASRAANLYTGTASAVSGRTLVVSGIDGGGRGAGWAKTGEIVVLSTGERRMVTAHVATDTLTLMYPFDVDPTGESVEVTRGCARSLAACLSIQGDVLNFGGWPHVPGRNVFMAGVK